MPPEQATAWADRHPIEWMSEFLRKRDVWVYQPDGNAIRGWIGLTANIVDGLYTCPEYARRGVASRLLLYVEAELQRRGFRDVRLEASVNAEQFYARRGYVIAGPRPADGAVPMSKTFPSAPA
jgi:putative acetyltransferase